MTRFLRNVTLIGLLAGAAACGNTGDEGIGDPFALATQTTRDMIKQRRGADHAPVAPRSPEAMAAEALAVNKSPLILVNFEKLGAHQVLAMTGENQTRRTYMTPAQEALILKDGMLLGTRGLGNDLSVAEPATEGLLRAGRAGQGQRIMRYYSADGLERPLQFDCSTASGPNAGVMIESCSGHGISFQNNYMVQNGRFTVSRQWAGPGLGYLTIQTLRH